MYSTYDVLTHQRSFAIFRQYFTLCTYVQLSVAPATQNRLLKWGFKITLESFLFLNKLHESGEQKKYKANRSKFWPGMRIRMQEGKSDPQK
jgi:hypothetical protein